MKRPKLPFILLIIFLVGILGISSLLVSQWSKESRKKFITVRLAESMPSIYKLPHYLALEKTFYKEHDIIIKPLNFKEDRQALLALSEEKVDVAIVSLFSLVLAKSSSLSEGKDPLVAFASFNMGTSYYLISRDNKPLENIQSLKKKTIITSPQDSQETVFFEQILRDEGLRPYETVSLITNIPEKTKLGALKAGIGHFLLVEEKDLQKALGQGFFSVKSFKTEYPSHILVTTRKFIDEQPKALQGITNGLYTAQLWMKYHTPSETAAILRNNREIDKDSFPGLVESIYNNSNIISSPVLEEKDIDLVAKLLALSKEIPMPVSGGDLVNGTFAQYAVDNINFIPEDKQSKNMLQQLKFW